MMLVLMILCGLCIVFDTISFFHRLDNFFDSMFISITTFSRTIWIEFLSFPMCWIITSWFFTCRSTYNIVFKTKHPCHYRYVIFKKVCPLK